jgi:16S rRNA (uracil1498-N3)-methyltransferase
MSDRFYTSSSLALGPALIQGPEAHHLNTVRRLGIGDLVTLFNGDGREYLGRIESTNRKAVAVSILEVLSPNRELPFRLELAAPLPKGDRADFLIEKLTELGVTDYYPLRTQRSVVHPRETKLDRLQRAVIEASKQCGRNVLMQIHDLVNWSEFCADAQRPAQRLVAHPGHNEIEIASRSEERAVAIGPEGGFTDEEMAIANQAHWRMFGLGPRILRVETAAIAAAVLASRH